MRTSRPPPPRLDALREAWLNPPDLVQRMPEVVPGYPDRLLPIDERAAAIPRKRTLTSSPDAGCAPLHAGL